jgi:hypothetical protein
MITIIIALLLQLGLLQSENQWYQLNPPQQQEMLNYIGNDEIHLG